MNELMMNHVQNEYLVCLSFFQYKCSIQAVDQ